MDIIVDAEKCTSCGECIRACPKGPRIYRIVEKDGMQTKGYTAGARVVENPSIQWNRSVRETHSSTRHLPHPFSSLYIIVVLINSVVGLRYYNTCQQR
ncbi:MAG: 4Fe-4S binding protein [Euryarchaeota archaeon]|nr:4Fe-4S binding protein [Euryarchaeota archaeon]MBU4492430.1 4Fe-4S binding protein [Euryarchaeota archaeon]